MIRDGEGREKDWPPLAAQRDSWEATQDKGRVPFPLPFNLRM